MNINVKKITNAGLVMVMCVASLVSAAQAQVPYRLNDRELESLLKRIEDNSGRFRKSFDHALDSSHLSGREKDRMNLLVKDFENATGHLQDRFNKRNSAAGDAEEVLNRAAKINEFMTDNIVESHAQDDWINLRGGLDELARAYNVSWRWITRNYRGTRISHENMEFLLDRSKRDADRFRYSLNVALERERFQDARREDHINQLVMDLQASLNHLQDRYRRNVLASSEVEDILHQSLQIDRFMIRNPLDYRAQNDWTTLRQDFDQIAQAYDVAWKW
jgi:hypothetical protein